MISGARRREFFDSRDKYLSFVHTTDEKVKSAFYIAKYLGKTPPMNHAYYVLDAGAGDGAVISTLLTAIHKKMPNTPIIVTAKEISIDDICILLSYLPDRFAEHKRLVFNITNMSYCDILQPPAVKFLHVKKELRGDTSHDFGLQLMNMSAFVKKHWALEVNANGMLRPNQKITLTIYRKDAKALLENVIPKRRADLANRFNLIIASQPFRLRRKMQEVVAMVLSPLLKMLDKGGRMILIYSSGQDFSRSLLRFLYPDINPYQNSAPAKLLSALKKNSELTILAKSARVDSFRYGFINMYTGRRDFSLGNIISLRKALTYVGQISDSEQRRYGQLPENEIRQKLARVKDMAFVNHVIHFVNRRRR